MNKGKVVLLTFPLDDLSTTKVRPAICLTDPIGPYRHIVVAFITSQIPPDLSNTDVVLDPTHADFIRTGLHVSSTLRLHRLVTVTTRIIQRQLGELSPARQAEVATKLRLVFDL